MFTTLKSGVLVPVLGALLAIGAACGSESTAEPAAGGVPRTEEEASYVDVSPQELKSMLERKDFLLVNVHIPYAGEIADTDLFIPYDEVTGKIEDLPSGRDAKVVVYCRSGSMSAIAAEALTDLGYTNVLNLDGGMIAWEYAGYPLVAEGAD